MFLQQYLLVKVPRPYLPSSSEAWATCVSSPAHLSELLRCQRQVKIWFRYRTFSSVTSNGFQPHSLHRTDKSAVPRVVKEIWKTHHSVQRHWLVMALKVLSPQQKTLCPRLHLLSPLSPGSPPFADSKRVTSPLWHWPLQSPPLPLHVHSIGRALFLQQIGSPCEGQIS